MFLSVEKWPSDNVDLWKNYKNMQLILVKFSLNTLIIHLVKQFQYLCTTYLEFTPNQHSQNSVRFYF